MLVALLQPSPETFDLFDDVMLLASGMVSCCEAGAKRRRRHCGLLTYPSHARVWHPALRHHHPTLITGPLSAPTPTATTTPLQILYHGPREGVLPFFRAHLGFDCPPRKGVADFLQEIALPSDQQVRM